MLDILLQQLGVDPAAVQGVLKTAESVGRQVEGFAATLARIEANQAKLAAALGVDLDDASGRAERVTDGKH